MSTRSLGNAAEEAALQLLLGQGMTCVARQYRISAGEIDLIMYDPASSTIVFVEVRSGDSERFPAYKESIKPAKIAKIAQVASHFLDNYTGVYDFVRLDAVFIERRQQELSIHLKNIAVLT